MGYKTNLCDFNCNYEHLKTRILITNPYGNTKLKASDKVLILGEMPV